MLCLKTIRQILNGLVGSTNISEAAKKIAKWRADPVSFVRDCFNVEPDAWQAEILQAFPKNQRLAMKAPLSFDNIVPTPDGISLWSDIKVGSHLFAEDGTRTKVIKRFDVGKADTYRVSFRDGTYIDASLDHEWKVQTTYDRKKSKKTPVYRTMTTKELIDSRLVDLKTGQRLISVPNSGPAQYPQCDSLPLDPYVFGLWIGDGSRNEPTIVCPDPEIRKSIEKRGYKTSLKADGKNVRVLNSVKEFINTGINDLYCFEKYIPKNYLYSSVDQRLELLRGMMDADGTVATNNHIYYASSSIRLIDDFIFLARSLGYVAKKMGPYTIKGGYRDSYRVCLCGPLIPFSAKTSKFKRWRKPVTGKFQKFITSIEYVGKKECMCVEVEHPSHCFLANDFTVTHNCKGPGKTAILSWLCWNFLATRPDPKLAATSITEDNLKDGLWAEMSKWQSKSEFLKTQFEWTKKRIFLKGKGETWFMSARTWSKSGSSGQQADSLAGLHADYIMFVLDEAGGIPDSVMAAAEAALSTGIESKIVMAGNPTHLEGPLFRACTQEAHLWYVVEITGDPDDPMRSPRISKQWARQQIEKYGRDNSWVLVNVFGKFPPASINTLLGPDEVRAAIDRHMPEDKYSFSQKRLGIDVARFGDDSTVIFPRQGLAAFEPVEMRDARSNEIAARVAAAKTKWGSEMEFVDGTGGYGSGVVDSLIQSGHTPQEVHFSAKATDDRYLNKRAEMWFLMAEWIKRGGSIPNVPRLIKELTSPTYTFQNGKFVLEKKAQIKERTGTSPDYADALALTFAIADAPARNTFKYYEQGYDSQASVMQTDFDPFAEDR